MIRTNAVLTLFTTIVLTATTAFAQSSDRLPVTDIEKIADALRAGPPFITKGRDTARLAIVAGGRLPGPSEGLE